MNQWYTYLRLQFFAFAILPSLVMAKTDWSFKVFPDTTRIRIGEQFSVFLQATLPPGEKVKFPAWNDSLMKGFELVSESGVDTIPGNVSLLTLRKKWLVTSFDSGYFPVPPLVARRSADGTDSLLSEAFLIGVQTIKVDTTASIKPIKGPLDPDFSLAEWWKEFVAALVLLAGILLYVLYFRKRKNKDVLHQEEKAKIQPLEWALAELENLRHQNLPAKGMVKEFYVKLSEILRTFFEMELGIPALESTTDEIIASLRFKGIPEHRLLGIRTVMQICDLAKFAKANPQQAEHDASFSASVDFVQFVSASQNAQQGDDAQ